MSGKALLWRESKRSVRKRIRISKSRTIRHFLFVFGLPFLITLLLSIVSPAKNVLFYFLGSSSFLAASSFTNFKEDWRKDMFDYILSMPIRPLFYILAASFSAALLTSIFVIPVALLLTYCIKTFSKISLATIDIVLVFFVPLLLGLIISFSSSTYLIFSLKAQMSYGIAYMVLLFSVILVFPFSQMIGRFDMNWIVLPCILAAIFGIVDIMIVKLLDKERTVTKV